ncbi:hypothetical protein SAMN02745751_02792 [Dethiosulfatibacter aminovorans DSM 17477]|uniref:Uncharacterized protein n=2 Tax=Dethiosulfatibacter TaxID=448125 RepID=A0A1M6K3F0_9FIRM|nr:hypothetical protein SAMN02745751_02792 [Dethiosulfatibacter aminovorans DSM 17477]
MLYYNDYNVRKSNMYHYIDEIEIADPDGDWYPLMNKFYAEGFSRYADEDVELLIMYSYGDFKLGTSTLFDSESPQFNSFYGCYIIKGNKDEYFGCDRYGKILIDRIALVPEYDFKYLVAGDMGLAKEDFFLEYEVVDSRVQNESDYLEMKIRTNSIYHGYEEFNINYVQYGIPYKKCERKDFYPIDIYCKLKIEKVENNTVIVYYIFTPTKELMDSWNGGIYEGLYN